MAQDQAIIGYASVDGTITSFACPQSTFDPAAYVNSFEAYALCYSEKGTYAPMLAAGTSCNGRTLLYTMFRKDSVVAAGESTRVIPLTGSQECSDGCSTWKIYQYLSGGRGGVDWAGRWLISCNDDLGIPKHISTLWMNTGVSWFIEAKPTASGGETPMETTSASSDGREPTDSDSWDKSTTQMPATSRPTGVVSRASEPMQSPTNIKAEEIIPGRTADDTLKNKTPNAGIIAGAVVGSIGILVIIIGSLILAFRMGKKKRNDPEISRPGFGNKFRSLPRPTIAWTRRAHDADITTARTLYTGKEQPGLIPRIQDRNPDLPATYIEGSNKSELHAVSLTRITSDSSPQPIHELRAGEDCPLAELSTRSN